MKVHNDFKISKLTPALQAQLDAYRSARGFNSKKIISAKIALINEYFEESNLSTAIVAVSGGVDSAVVLGLLHAAAGVEGSPIRNVVPVTLPAKESVGATGQQSSQERAGELVAGYGLKLVTLDISGHLAALSEAVERSVDLPGSDWSKGQLVAYLRTPILYYYTTLYSDSGAGALLVGTTNADEGQYIGYIGKASDAMVDLQIISDLHKSEIYALAKELRVPESIINVAPTGDMFDGRVDEEVFGFPYGFVELYRSFLVMNSVEKSQFIAAVVESGEKEIFDKLQKNVEKMHKYNMHKYLGCSPSVHLDVLDSRVPRGWKYFNYESVR